MKDRQPTPGMEGRMLITPEDGSSAFYAVISMADNPLDDGTPLSKETLLKDSTAKLYDKDDSAVPDEIFVKLFPAMPTGTISWLASEAIPDGFLKCDGASVAKADYPELYAVIGDTFGDGTDTTFKLPDLRAKFIRGAGTSGNYSAVFGQTQDGSSLISNPFSAIMPTVKNPENELSYASGCIYGGSGSSREDCHEYGLRPYNIALTPIIKYCGG